MEANEYKKGYVVVLELKGRVDEFNSKVLSDEIHTIINTGRFFIVIDLINTNFLSADCLQKIWNMQRKAKSLCGEIVLSGASGTVLETINFVDFDKVVKRFYEISEAISFLQSAALTVEAKKTIKLQPRDAENSSEKEKKNGLTKLLLNFLGKVLKTIFCLSLICASERTLGADPAAKPKGHSYSLEEVLSLAREISPGIKLARLKMIEKDADVRIARSLGLPKLIATGGYLYESNPTVISDIINKEINNIHQPSQEFDPQETRTRTKININKDAALVGLGFAQLLYSGGLFKSQMDLREAQKKEADIQVTLEMLAVEEQVRNLFLGLLLAKEKITYIESHKNALLQKKAAAEKALAMKTMSTVQFSEIELLEFKITEEQLSAEKDEQSMRGLLNIMLDRPIDEELTPLPLTIAKDFKLESAEHYFEIALHRFPELKKRMVLMDSAAAYQHIVDAQRVLSPQLLSFGSLQYSYGLGTTTQEVSWSLGVGFYLPLYDGRKSNAEMEKATSLSSQARLAYEAAERKLRIDINEVVSEIRKSQIEQQLAQKTYEIALKKKLEAQEAVNQGQLPLYKLSEVIAGELEAKIAIISSQAGFYKWYAKLMLLTGQKEQL